MFNMSSLSTFLGGTLLFLYREEIKDLALCSAKYMVSKISNILAIKTLGSEKLLYALRLDLEARFLTTTKERMVTDGPYFTLPNGLKYFVYNGNLLFVNLQDNEVKIWSILGSSNLLDSYLKEITEKYSTTVDVILHYLINGDSWGCPIYRRPIYNRLTLNMKKMANNVDKFLKEETLYEKNGWPFRKGYLIEGPSGTGKSTMINYIAKEHNMSIYTLMLNTNGLDDNRLLHLVGTVPPKSLLIIDEADRQYESIKTNTNVNISASGLLTALDGPTRTSHGTIIIMTVNDKTKLNDIADALFRKGRIDKTYTFDEIL